MKYNYSVLIQVTPADIKWQEGAKFFFEITSLGKNDKISTTKQPMCFYYMAKGREECRHGYLSTLLSFQYLIMTEKCQRKQSQGRLLPIPQYEKTWRVGWAKGPHCGVKLPKKHPIRRALGKALVGPSQHYYRDMDYINMTYIIDYVH